MGAKPDWNFSSIRIAGNVTFSFPFTCSFPALRFRNIPTKPITYPLEPHNISVVRESEIICQNLAAKNKPFAKKSKAVRPLCHKYRISVSSVESHYILATEDCRGAKRYVVRRSLSVLNKLFYDGGERGTLTFL